jgi:hypothetical protein
MRYLLLIYGDESQQPQEQPDDPMVALKPWWEYNEWLKEKGWYVGGDALQPTSTATTVRVREGKALTTDGPFAETKEQLGGFWIITAPDLDAALAWAAKATVACKGAVEVRPFQEEPEA